MPLEILLTYTLVTTSFLLIPGPTILLVISYSLLRGRKALVYLVLGVGLGDLTAITFSFFGLGLLLEKVTIAFYFLKWIGAVYLIWLGIKMWRIDPNSENILENKNIQNSKEIFINAYVVTALNPKSIVFFLAFIPQFIDPISPFYTQSFILGVIFIILAIITVFGYSTLASFLSQQLHLTLVKKWTQRIGSVLLVIAGGMTAANI